jgi:hypothetical protein
VADLVDDRPIIEPTLFSYRTVPEGFDGSFVPWREMAESLRAEGATFWRFTIVSPEYPRPPYPDGLYAEGWSGLPDCPWKQAPFNFPLTVAEGASHG